MGLIYKKFIVLESKLLELQAHTGIWHKALSEYKRLYKIYNKERMAKWEKYLK